MLKITSKGVSDVGQKRSNNEDYLLVDEGLGLYVVCDGMGGHDNGEVASMEAANAAAAFLRERSAEIESFDETAESRDKIRSLVASAVQVAGRRVWQLNESGAGGSGMGTTCTLLLVRGRQAVMGHVGDSRMYLSRGGKVHQLSQDHTLVAELVRQGQMPKEKAELSPLKNVVVRSLGKEEWVAVDVLLFDVLPGDTFLMCSDGLTGHVSDDGELASALAGDPEHAAQLLVDLANERGGQDNITVLVVRAETGEGAEDPATTSTLEFKALEQATLLRFLTARELMQLRSISEKYFVDSGQIVFSEGDEGDRFFVLVDGQIEVTRGGLPVSTLTRGAHFGEVSVLNNRPRMVTTQAKSPCRMLAFSQERLHDLLGRHPSLGVKLLWTVAQVLGLRLEDSITMMGEDIDDLDFSAVPEPADGAPLN